MRTFLLKQYTFILPASKQLPKQCIKAGMAAKYASRKHIGVRIPDDSICQAILQNLDAPLVCTRLVETIKIACTYSKSFKMFLLTKLMLNLSSFCVSNALATCMPIMCISFFSVKWPEKDQWMLDPVIIADTYEPEV